MKNNILYLKKHAKTSIYVLLSFSIVSIIGSLISKYFIANFENIGINCNRIRVNPTDNSFNVNKKSTFIALMDETTKNHSKFFNFVDVNELAIFYYLFDQSVKKELGL